MLINCICMKIIRVFSTIIVLFICVVPSVAQTWSWTKAISGLDSIEVRDFRMDSNGDLLILGYHVGQITFDSQTLPPFGKKDLYLIKLDQAGTLKWMVNAGKIGRAHV